MKLPKHSAKQSIVFSAGRSAMGLSVNQTVAGSVQMEGFLSNFASGLKSKIKSVGSCAVSCGPEALNCLHCATNINCWKSCAGPTVANCIISKCL
jgi:hypothetical protein